MPIAKVQLSDGRVARFEVPEGTSEAEVMEAARQLETQEQPRTVLGDIGNAITQRSAEADAAKSMPFGRRQLRQAATGARFLGDVTSAVTPDVVEDALGQLIGYGVEGVRALPMGQEMLNLGTTVPQDLRNAGVPEEVMQDLQDAATVAAFFAPIKLGGKAVRESGVKSAQALNYKAAQKAVSEGVSEEAILQGRVKDKLFGRDVVPSKFEKEMADQVTKVPDFKRKGSIVNNTVKVKEFADKKAEALKSELEKSKVKFKPEAIERGLDSVVANLKKNPQLITDTTGELLPSARLMLNIYKEQIDKFPKTPAGLLEARKSFDQELKKMRGGEGILDPKYENAKTIITRELRTKTNELIDDVVQKANVKSSLKEQHLLYSAAEEMARKGKKTAETPLGRGAQSVLSKVPLKGEIAGLAALGGLGTAGYLNPYVAGGALGAYGAYKGATSPASRVLAGRGLQALEAARVPQLGLVNLLNQEQPESVVFR